MEETLGLVGWIEGHPTTVAIIFTTVSAIIGLIFGGVIWLIKDAIFHRKSMNKNLVKQQEQIDKLTEISTKMQSKFNKGMCAFKSIAIDLRDKKVLSPETDLKIKEWLEEN